MTEIENSNNPIYLIVLSHEQKQVDEKGYLTITSQQRVLGAVSRYEELVAQGFNPIVVFTGGMKPNAKSPTSELMSTFFNDLTGFPSTALPLSNETDGNIKTCFENIPDGVKVEVLSHSYHNLFGRVDEVISRYKGDREVNFIGIEGLHDNYVDTNIIPESLRFSNAFEAMQCILLPLAGRIGIDLPSIYKNFSKVRLLLNRAKKI